MGHKSLLTYYENLPENSDLPFKYLCKKVYVLFLILEARRKDSLLKTDIANVLLENEKVTLLPNKTLKHLTPERLIQSFVCHKYNDNENYA